MTKIDVGDGLSMVPGKWEFDGIESTFDQHVIRSVPMYEESHYMVIRLAEYFIGNASKILDVGCSTGTLLGAIADLYSKIHSDLHFIGVDPAPGMVEATKVGLSSRKDITFEILQGSFMDFEYADLDLVTALYTLQFMHPAVRYDAIKKINASLKKGGALILFEKIKADSPLFNEIFSEQYGDFKSRNGFSEEEKVNKAKSLRGVMRPFTESENLRMLEQGGFRDVCRISRWFCFEGYLAVK